MDKRWIVASVAAVGLALIVVTGGVRGWGSEPGDSHAPAAAGPLPEFCDPNPKAANLNFTLQDINGRSVNLASLKGKVILLDFWATWCGPCKVEIPHFVELHAKYKDRGFTVVGVSVDDTLEQLKPFAAEYRMNYPVLLGREHEAIQEAFGPIWGLPTAFIIARDGSICKKHMGLKTKEQFEKEILGLL